MGTDHAIGEDNSCANAIICKGITAIFLGRYNSVSFFASCCHNYQCANKSFLTLGFGYCYVKIRTTNGYISPPLLVFRAD